LAPTYSTPKNGEQGPHAQYRPEDQITNRYSQTPL